MTDLNMGLIERLRLASLAENTMYGDDAGNLYDEAAEAISSLLVIKFICWVRS